MIGIDISDRSIKLVQLTGGRSPQLLAHCWKALPADTLSEGVVQNQKQLVQVIQETLAACKLATPLGDMVVASIPEAQSFLRVIEIPMMDTDEIGEAIKWEVTQHIPFGLENVYIDWQPLRGGHTPARGHQEVLVGAAQRKVVDSLYTTLQVLRFDVAALELESQALTRALISPDLQQKQGILIVDFGGTKTNVIVHDHGTLRFTATLPKGVNRAQALVPPAHAARLDSGMVDLTSEERVEIAGLIRPALEEVVTEIRGVVEFYNSIDQQHEVREIVLVGGGSNLPGLEEVFPRYFSDVHVQRGNPWANILSGKDLATLPLSVTESVRYATALGLTLRPALPA